MATLVKQWNVSKLRIIYGDGFVTKSILHKLNITNTCILHGDYWHLIHKILPRPENFGTTTFCLIKPYVEMMISSDTKAQWDLGYSQARRVIISKPRELSLLEKIYGDPEYYGGYYLRTLVCNLKSLGSVSVEQNHAANVRHLGKGAHWCIAEQCSHLLEKHQENTKKFNNIEIDWWYKFVYCKETYIDDDNDEDMKARECLAK